jgi:hypothetical protein
LVKCVEYPRQESNSYGLALENATEARHAAQNPAHFEPETLSIDPELTRLIEMWPTLSERIRAAVVALLDSTADAHCRAPATLSDAREK